METKEKHDTKIKSRVFIVGCPRSGTTLFQTMLGAHPSIVTFPETHFFEHYFLGKRAFLSRLLGKVYAKHLIRLWARRFGYEKIIGKIGDQTSEKMFIKFLDEISISENGSVWVEKTPSHLHCIEKINKEENGVKFFHVVRDGRAVVASLLNASEREKRWKKYSDLEKCIARWKECFNLTKKWASHENHWVINYERLTEKAELVVKKACKAIKVNYEPKMISEFASIAKIATRKDEIWKDKNFGPLNKSNLDEFESRFSKEDQRSIYQALDIDNYLEWRSAYDLEDG